MIRVEHGDCLEVIPQLVAEGVLVDAIVTDPPYHLTSGNLAVDWAAFGPRADGGSDRGPTNGSRRKTGFMGKAWDGGDIAFRPETWAAAYGILKPGGYLLAFGGERTFHRMWCAIEDAGFVLQTTLCWLWGSGFPKHKSDLKPSWNPIALAYKPGGKRELQIDECRVGFVDEVDLSAAAFGNGSARRGGIMGENIPGRGRAPANPVGRWPANCVHDGSDEVMEAFATFETHSAGALRSGGQSNQTGGGGMFGVGHHDGNGTRYGDTGSPARFFYCAKAGKADRVGSKHPTVKPIALMRWLVRLVTPLGGTVLDPFAGSGTTAAAAIGEGRNAILIEREDEYIGDIQRRLAVSRGESGHSMVSKRLDQQEVRGTLL